MVSVSEEANSTRVRVFRWNEKLSTKEIMECEALLLLRISNKFITINPDDDNTTNHQEEISQSSSEKLDRFERLTLLSNDSITSLTADSLTRSKEFLSNTVLSLAPQISTFLISRFRFTPQNLLLRNQPIIVIVVDIDRTRTVDYSNPTTHNTLPSSSLFPPRSPPHSSNYEIDDDDIGGGTAEDPILFNCNWEEDVELGSIMYSLCYLLGEPWKYPLKPMAEDEPVGLFEVDPESEHVWVRKNGKAEAAAAAVGVCAICLEVMPTDPEPGVIIETSCLHVFHYDCLSRWCSKSIYCPTCRIANDLLMSKD